MIIYPIRGNYTICSIKSLVSNEISFSSIKFHVRLIINYCEIYKQFLDSVIFGEGYHIRQYIVLLRYFANGEVIESSVVSW